MKKQIKQLFVQDLVKVQGGVQGEQKKLMGDKCPEITTLACGGVEESFKCVGC
jgi:hypothetical protein